MIFNWEFYKDKNTDLHHLKNEEEYPCSSPCRIFVRKQNYF
jgi:hypothetical protein